MRVTTFMTGKWMKILPCSFAGRRAQALVADKAGELQLLGQSGGNCQL